MGFVDFISTYWLQIAAPIVLLIIYVCYNKGILFEEEEKRRFKKYFVLLIILVVWIEARPIFNGYFTSIKYVDLPFYTLVWAFLLSLFFFFREKYLTTAQVMADGISGSYNPNTPPIKVGLWTVFNVGSSNHTFAMDQGDTTLVVPTRLIRWVGPKAYCDVKTTRRPFRKLPLVVRNHLLGLLHIYNEHDCRIGLFSREEYATGWKMKGMKGKELSLAEFEEEFFNLEQSRNTYQDFADGNFKRLEDAAAHQKRMGKTMKGNDMFKVTSERRNDEEYGSN